MIRRIGISIAGVFVLCAASAHADEADCVAARYKAAGKYAACEAKVFVFNNGFKYQECNQRYAATWARLGKKYPGTSCDGARFADNGITITDNLTQLVWEKKTTALGSGTSADRHDVDNIYSWSATPTTADGTTFTDFLDDLNSTGFAGQHDWRLPTLFELHTILTTEDFPCTAPCVVDPLFSPTQSDVYWSSSTDQVGPALAWTVNFVGGTDSEQKMDSHYVRAVRGGF
jgi:hypothetical protein